LIKSECPEFSPEDLIVAVLTTFGFTDEVIAKAYPGRKNGCPIKTKVDEDGELYICG